MALVWVGGYRLSKKIISGDPKRGVPELWQAEDYGDLYYAKVWPRGTGDAVELQALWNREVRGLMRLQSYPGASDLFVKLRDLDFDDKHFFAILDGGRRLVLHQVLQDRNRFNWLTNLPEVGRRRPLWEGMLRVAEALSILHREGTLHRSLTPASIFVNPDGQGEFRLSGFEWSLRLAGSDAGATSVGSKGRFVAPELDRADGEYSTATDWYDFGLVAAELFGTPLKTTRKRAAVQTIVSGLPHLRESERTLINRLLMEDREQRLSDADEIIQDIHHIIRDLSAVTTSVNRNLVLAVRLGAENDLSRTIEAISGGSAPISNPMAQRDWIRRDLKGDVRVIARGDVKPYYVLKGESLEYRVRQWSVKTLTTWDIGYCEGMERIPKVKAEDQVFTLGGRKIDVQLLPQVFNNVRTVRDRAAQWDKTFPIRAVKRELSSELRTVHDFFRITQHLDILLTIAQMCAVDIVSVDRGPNDTTIAVTPVKEPERATLARYLGLDAPPEQLRDWFKLGAEAVGAADDDGEPKEAQRYAFLERRSIGTEQPSSTWRFVRGEQQRGGPVYYFRTQAVAAVREGRAYLARNYGGTIALIRRRQKAIEDLRLYEGLLRMIATPADVARSESAELPVPRTDIELDESKLEALRNLWGTQPSFAIQGPPGTGKTTLIKAFADRLFNADSSAQILLTAHSHHTVDDVREKLSKLFTGYANTERPIVLRLGAAAGDIDSTEQVTDRLLSQLRDSELARRAPDHLAERLEASSEERTDRASQGDTDVRTMQVLIQDAANLTFATLNSPDLADLASRGRRFDWSIIEEAGKAHGFDMATALQESHRLLLIGDHHQLPPFNVKIFTDLLGSSLKVRKAVLAGYQFAPTLIDPALVADDDDRAPFDERCRDWSKMVRLFEIVFSRSLEGGRLNKPAAVLTDQHRMHPHIADLVGKVFYPAGEGRTILRSPAETHARFGRKPPFSIKADSWLTDERVVWCDVPWERKEEFAEGEVEGLFVSRPEARLVVDVLEQFRGASKESCEIQILSPYKDQLVAIREEIEHSYSTGGLAHMFEEPFDLRQGKRRGATVDEFQGSEADIVVVSLVRNNALLPWKSVGFLKESNRMNVLLSRARHKLVIIGSWDFFASRCDEYTSEFDEHYYLKGLMAEMEAGRLAGTVAKLGGTS